MSTPTIDPPASSAKQSALPTGSPGGGPRDTSGVTRVASGRAMRTPSVVTEYRGGSWINTVAPSGPIDEQFSTADEAWTAGYLIAVLIQAEHVLVPQGRRVESACCTDR